MADYTLTQQQRSHPQPEWIAEIRRRFPVERALDQVLTSKLVNRGNSVEHKMDFSGLPAKLDGYLKQQTGQQDLTIANLKRLTGGASKEQFTFDLTWRQTTGAVQTRKLILRMDPSESIVETHRLREAEMLQAMWGEVPVPEVFWVDPDGEHLGHPSLIAGFLEGTVQPEGGNKASGLGMYFEPALRAALKDQFVRHLAHIHQVDWRRKKLSSYDAPAASSKQANLYAVGLWERVWHEDTLEAHPIVEAAALWLKENMPVVDNPVIVHGDYRSGNFMYTPERKINAILDWELCHIGDFHEDLAYTSSAVLGTPDGRGNILASGLLTRSELIETYESYSGFTVDKKKLFYFDVFSYYKMAVIAVATSLRTAHGRKTHLDAMMNLLSGFGFIGLSALQRLLDEGCP
ncbi:MAG: phosphotransferase family protein [Porticoccaceae bacterium]